MQTTYATRLIAGNAARKEFGKDYKEMIEFAKLPSGEWAYFIKGEEQEPSEEQAIKAAEFAGNAQKAEEELDEGHKDMPSPTAEEWTAMNKAAEEKANQAAATSGKPGKEWVRASSIEKPTKAVWHIADEMMAAAAAAGKEAPSRKDVQAECVRRGIASGTARTQYQAWKTARDNDRANAANAAAASARINGKGI